MDLKARLRRYRDARKPPASAIEETEPRSKSTTGEGETNKWPGWIEAGFNTLRREVVLEPGLPVPGAFPDTLPIVIPDFLRIGKLPSLMASPGDLLFFDLETTGLSGGAGTIAFLAAFGRFAVSRNPGDACNACIVITQYLLLDYPGESNFIERVADEFSVNPPPLVLTYNGKCFDSQILKNRCLMN